MNDAVAATRKYLADRLSKGIDHAVRVGPISGMVAGEFCQADKAAAFISGMDSLFASGRVLKDDRAAKLVQTTWNGRQIVIKAYSCRGIHRKIAHCLRGSRAARTWFFSHLLGRIGVRTAAPLAYFEQRKVGLPWRSYVIMEYVRGRNLHHVLREATAIDSGNKGVISAVKRSMDILASHGLSHGDMKHSNFLVTPEGPVIIDLDAMKEGRPGRDIRRFMQGVNTTDVPEGIRQMCREVFAFDGPLPYSTSSDYMTARSDKWRLFVRRGYLLADAMHIVEGDAVCRDTHRFSRVFSSDFTRVYTSTAQHKGSLVSVHVKHYLSRSPLDPFKHLLLGGRGRRAFEASLMLRHNGFDSPQPLVFIERHEGPFRMDNVLVTETISHALQLNTQLMKLVADSSPSGREQRGSIIRQLGAVVGRMHKAGIFHGDLRLGNVLLQKNEGSFRFYFIDNERTRKYDRLPLRLRIRNLVQINMFRSGITNTDRARFWAAYVKETQATQEESRRWIRSVLRQTEHRLTTRLLHHPYQNAGNT